jgi:hypothetical protein
MELKEFPNRKSLTDFYNFPRGKSNELGSLWFMVPLNTQLSYFKNGLGRIIYFKTIERDLTQNPYIPELESKENQMPIYYEMITDYVLLSENIHPEDCECGCPEENKAGLLKVDGFDDCYLGIGETYGSLPALVYDQTKIIEKLKQDGMDEEEAQEFFDFNILGAYLGEKMPIFLRTVPLEDLD